MTLAKNNIYDFEKNLTEKHENNSPINTFIFSTTMFKETSHERSGTCSLTRQMDAELGESRRLSPTKQKGKS